MERATHICTHCGYEGKPQKPPSDAEVSDDGASKALARIANLVLPGSGLIIKPLAIFISLPIHLLLWPLKKYMSGGPKHCPNCGLPLMVRLSSDAGFVAKRKMDLKAGIRFDKPETPPVAFGREVKLPGDEEAAPAPAPKLEKLPTLNDMLVEEPVPVAAPQPKEEAPKPVKKHDPEAW